MIATSCSKPWTRQRKSLFAVVRIAFAVRSSSSLECIPDIGGVKKDKYKSPRAIPFLIAPFTVKKVHHLFESTSVPNVMDKFNWVTKTIPSGHLPPYYTDVIEDNDMYQGLLSHYEDCLFHTVTQTKLGRGNPKDIPDRINYSLLPDLLRITMAYGEDAGHLRPENSFLYHKVLLETSWPRNFCFYRLKMRPDYVLRTKGKLDVIEQSQPLTKKEVFDIPGPFEPVHMKAFRVHDSFFRSRPGMDNYKANPIKNAHTTILFKQFVQEEELTSLGLTSAFTQAAAQAQGDGQLHGTELETPLVTQSIVTNGHKVVFTVFQLNTLHLQDDKGLWNRCWQTPVLDLFDKRKDMRDREMHLYESSLTGFFDEECFSLFFKFIRNGTV